MGVIGGFGEEHMAGVLAETGRPVQGRALREFGRERMGTVSSVARSRSPMYFSRHSSSAGSRSRIGRMISSDMAEGTEPYMPGRAVQS